MLKIEIRGKPKTGKTTIALAICEMLAERDYRVKLVDADRDFEQFDCAEPTVQVVTVQENKGGGVALELVK